MRIIFLIICSMLILSACGGKQGQAENADEVAADNTEVRTESEKASQAAEQVQDLEPVRAFVQHFYEEWEKSDILDYDYVKQHITPNLLKFLQDSYEYDCEGECLATWKFYYEGGGDVGELEDRNITARDANHVLVENQFDNYEYDLLLTVIKDGDTFKIDSLKQIRSEYK